jgi:hypothetical protein
MIWPWIRIALIQKMNKKSENSLLCSCVSDEEEILDEGVAKQGEPSQVEHAISDDNDTVDSSRESSSDESLK